MKVPALSEHDVLLALKNAKTSHQSQYYAMYSSLFGGIVKDPHLMFVPIDDHMVHRGDGVFEAFKVKDSKVYLMTAHLDRLEASADSIGLELPVSRDELLTIIRETLRAASKPDALVRLFVSRGPGGFTTNPYETIGAQLYIVVTELKEPAESRYEAGVTAGISAVPSKDTKWAGIKCCNYLPNVLMKKEAVDRGLDFTITQDENGHLGEGSTENIAGINSSGELIFPPFDRTLKGTTLIRLSNLAQELVSSGELSGVRQHPILVEELPSFKEMFFVGTTLDVLPIRQIEKVTYQTPYEKSKAKKLRSLLQEDMNKGPFATPY